jgi:hypothetical protein
MRLGVGRWFSLAALLLLVLLVLKSAVGGLVAISAAEVACQNTEIREVEGRAARLPDCRAYEQASPVEKNLADAAGKGGFVQSAPLGERVAYFSLLPFPVGSGGGDFPTYLSRRNGEGEDWTYTGLLPPSDPATPASVVGFTENLNESIVTVGPQGPLLAVGATSGGPNTYLRGNATESYRLLAGSAAVFTDATPDGAIIVFEDKSKLTENAGDFTSNSKATNLYEWENGAVSLIGVLPGKVVPKEGSVAGPGGKAIRESEEGEIKAELPGGSTGKLYTQNTISEDGSRVFFTDVETGRIYVREPKINETIEVSQGQAYWRAATPDGSYVFYTEGKGEERNLYRFNVNTKTREPLTTGMSHVLGTVGITGDGASVYFVAEAPLASGSIPEQANLYGLRVGEQPEFITTLNIERDESDWTNAPVGLGPAEGGKSSRVAPGGESVLFTSHNKLTSYDNAGQIELYLYRPTAGGPTCVSCNPSGTKATSGAHLTGHNIFGPEARNAFLTRNLSVDGSRVFFQTAESLLPEDTNGLMDVYEWEREGSGSCVVGGGDGSGGCLFLISTGKSTDESYFGDASLTGGDVFFFTRQGLVAQDRDDNTDLYDARVGGGFAAQNVVAPAPCGSETECRVPGGGGPVLGVPVSVGFSGPGDAVLGPEEPGPGPKPGAGGLTRAQKLAKALKACKKVKGRGRRVACRARAKRRYGAKGKGGAGVKKKKSGGRGA